jgi:hypothetical protein
MWVPGNIMYIAIASILFIRWMQLQDAKQREREAAMDMDEFEGEEDEAEVI